MFYFYSSIYSPTFDNNTIEFTDLGGVVMTDEKQQQDRCEVMSVTAMEEPDYSQCDNCQEEHCPLMDGLC